MIILNGDPYPYKEGMTVKSLMREKKFVFRYMIIAINDVIIPENKWPDQPICDGDTVRMEHIFGGG